MTPTPEQLRGRCIMALARGVSGVTLDKVAQQLGVVPPRYDTSHDAGRPVQPVRQDSEGETT